METNVDISTASASFYSGGTNNFYEGGEQSTTNIPDVISDTVILMTLDIIIRLECGMVL